jgi:hypothetical protein
MTADRSRTKPVRWLAFLEDPGACTFFYQLPAALRERGVEIDVLATGHAVDQLAKRSVRAQGLDESSTAEEIFATYQPSVLIIGTSENPDSFAFSLLALARQQGLPTVGLVDALGNASQRFRGRESDSLAWAPDWLIVPDAATAREYELCGFDRSRLRVCGHPQYDLVVSKRERWTERDRTEQRAAFLSSAGDRKILVFVSELSTGLNPDQFRRSTEYTLTGHPESYGRTEVVLDELLCAVNELRPEPYLVLRLHPKQHPSDLQQYLGYFDQISQSEPALELVNAADAVVGMTSMLLVEAALLGRPTLSVVPRPEERKWLGELADVVTVVWLRDDLRRELPQLLKEKGGIAGILEAEHRASALERVCEFLVEELAVEPKSASTR